MKTIRIGSGGGFWGDSEFGVSALVERGELDYLIFDYLAETTMALLSSLRHKDKDKGYVEDFVSLIGRFGRDIADRNIKIIANAGGLNPKACQRALSQRLRDEGVNLNIAVVTGDCLIQEGVDVSALSPFDNASITKGKCLTANAYLGALPVQAALAKGADIVITGRVVDSALCLGPLMHEFSWSTTDYDKLASGSIAGHIIECGAQCTGGNYTDWQQVLDYAHIGYPIVLCREDGSFEVTKPEGTGGLVNEATVSEQLLYEVNDPSKYLLPDVTCDISQAKLKAEGPNRVSVTNIFGFPPSNQYKVSACFLQSYRASALFSMIGDELKAKAETITSAILTRVNEILQSQGIGSIEKVQVDYLGTESTFADKAKALSPREIVVRMVADHPDKKALMLFSKEIAQASTSMPPALTQLFGGRPKIQPVIAHQSFIIDKSKLSPSFSINDVSIKVDQPIIKPGQFKKFDKASVVDKPVFDDVTLIDVPLIKLAHARSGDKGNTVNIAVIVREPDYLPWFREHLNVAFVKRVFSHLVSGEIKRYEVPGLNAFNFVLHEALDGGGLASQRVDPLGKAYAQMLLVETIKIPQTLYLD